MREIALTRGLVTVVDDADVALVLSHGKWYADRNCQTFYARKNYWQDGACRSLRLHTVLTGWTRVDHVDGNGLNNCRANLRPATSQQNARNRGPRSDNTSGYKGVGRRGAGWEARIWIDGGNVVLGVFADPRHAALTYDAAAYEHFGEFARPNFPQEMTA